LRSIRKHGQPRLFVKCAQRGFMSSQKFYPQPWKVGSRAPPAPLHTANAAPERLFIAIHTLYIIRRASLSKSVPTIVRVVYYNGAAFVALVHSRTPDRRSVFRSFVKQQRNADSRFDLSLDLTRHVNIRMSNSRNTAYDESKCADQKLPYQHHVTTDRK
jgi:hypothetical protein